VASTTRRARKDRTGRDQRARSATARARRPNLVKLYGRQLPPVTPGEFEFELTLLRGRGISSLALDDAVTSFGWNDSETMMSGDVTLRRPDPSTAKDLPIGRGHKIRCRVKWAGRWYELWTMRCDAPTITVETGEIVVALKDDMALVRMGAQRMLYRRSKRRPHGYFGHEMLRAEARKQGIRLGAIAKCTKRIAKVDVRGSFLDLAVKVYGIEHSRTGRKFVLRMRDGKFEVVPYKRNQTIYVLAAQIRSAVIEQTPKVEIPATVLKGRGRVGKGTKATTVRYTAQNRSMVARFGHVERTRNYGHVDSAGDLRGRVQRDLAKQYKVDRVVTVEHQGIPFIRRGDGAQAVLASEGIEGEDSFVYCTGARHQVQGATYTATYTFTFDDPFEKDREAREKAARAKARRAHAKRDG